MRNVTLDEWATLKPTMTRWQRGVVCDAASVAIPSATVELHYGHFAFNGKLFESMTDEQGLFEFEEVLTGVYYTLVARLDDRENFRVTKTPTVADVVIPLPPAQTNGLVALLSWGVVALTEGVEARVRERDHALYAALLQLARGRDAFHRAWFDEDEKAYCFGDALVAHVARRGAAHHTLIIRHCRRARPNYDSYLGRGLRR